MDEIRQRMEQDQELFQLRREKLELELERERVLLEISRQQLEKMSGTVQEVVFTSKDEVI